MIHESIIITLIKLQIETAKIYLQVTLKKTTANQSDEEGLGRKNTRRIKSSNSRHRPLQFRHQLLPVPHHKHQPGRHDVTARKEIRVL